MNPALLLVDLQRDYLDAPGLEPPMGAVVARAAALLGGARSRGLPVIHVWTTVSRTDDRRMPHWRAAGRWRCEANTPGHATPPELAPVPGETVVHKTDFSAFGAPDLDAVLQAAGVDAVLLAGVHLHACVRATALDAYARRLEVWIADDAVASDDPLHAAITREYLAARSIRFRPVATLLRTLDPPAAGDPAPAPRLPAVIVDDICDDGAAADAIVHEEPAATGRVLWRVPVGGPAEIARATAAGARTADGWAAALLADRRRVLERLAVEVEAQSLVLAEQLACEVGKPIVQAREEVTRAVGLLRSVAARGADDTARPCGPASERRDRPLGVVALVTPWNNPLAIPIGKLAPALLFGNVVVWKPAPAGTGLAVRVMELLRAAGCPPGVVGLCCGDGGTAAALMADPVVDGVALTGGSAAGYAAQAICGRRRIPLQAELGGNNAALVAADADLEAAARAIAEGAFAFAGQRCTANRRVVVERACADAFVRALRAAVETLRLGAPSEPSTQIGPLIDVAARARVAAAVERAHADGAVALGPPSAAWPNAARLACEGAYLTPTVLECVRAESEIVQEETFGPVLVVQRASDWDDAIRLANAVRHGLVAAAFTGVPAKRDAFFRRVRAGILKIDDSTAGADVEAPFGGWKASGVGPPEHGESNRAIYTRPQALYRGDT